MTYMEILAEMWEQLHAQRVLRHHAPEFAVYLDRESLQALRAGNVTSADEGGPETVYGIRIYAVITVATHINVAPLAHHPHKTQ